MLPIVLLIVLLVFLYITNPLIAILHELGHAFAYLILTSPEKVDVYLGSYGDAAKNVNFKIGKLDFHIKRSFPFIKGTGLCKSSKIETRYRQKIIILLAGPVFTFCIAVAIGFIVFNSSAHGSVKLYCFAFLIFSGISLIINLKPRVINTGNITLDNDGKQLLFLIKVRSRYSDYLESITNFNNVEYEKAVPKLKNVLQSVPGDQNILRMLFNLLLQVKKIEDAFFYLSEFELRFGLSAHELLIKGCLLSALKNHEEAISTYRSVLKTDAVDLTSLNNLGYELREKGELAEAEELLNKAITIDPEFDHAYGNLGFIKVLEGDLEAGKTLIDKSLALNNENAFAYKYLGTYYLKTGNLPLANFNFNKVKELDGTIDLDLRDDEVNALRKLYPENKSEIEHPKSEITPKSP